MLKRISDLKYAEELVGITSKQMACDKMTELERRLKVAASKRDMDDAMELLEVIRRISSMIVNFSMNECGYTEYESAVKPTKFELDVRDD